MAIKHLTTGFHVVKVRSRRALGAEGSKLHVFLDGMTKFGVVHWSLVILGKIWDEFHGEVAW